MTDPAAIAFLRAAIAALQEANEPDVIAGRDAVAEWLDGGVREAFEVAIGLPRNWRAEDARARRDHNICELADRHFAAETKRGRAASIAAALRRYAVRWQREKELTASPHSSGSHLDLCWQIFRAQEIVRRGHIPIDRTIREILRDRPPRQMAVQPTSLSP